MDPRLEGYFSIKGAQKAIQLATRCLSRHPKARPIMSEVVETLEPLPYLTDMASSSYFQAMQMERAGSNSNVKQGTRVQANISMNTQPMRRASTPNGPQASPHHGNNPNWSLKPSNNPHLSPNKPNVNPGNNPEWSLNLNANQP